MRSRACNVYLKLKSDKQPRYHDSLADRPIAQNFFPRRNASRCLHSSSLQWEPVPVLQDSSATTFRRDAFHVQWPAVTPPACFKELPAIGRWFKRSHQQNPIFELDLSYLEQYGDAIVPLELNSSSESHSDLQNTSFQRSEAPLSIFLRWAERADAHSRQRLYLAQASISDLPEQLRNDLPTPKLVLDAGNGDVYDTNIWLGVAPTYTPLHRDPNPNLFVQLVGQKIVRLLPPEAGQEVFLAVQAALGRNASSVFRGDEMMQGDEKKLLEDQIWRDRHAGESLTFPRYEAALSSGDGLFIPKGWWHSIKGVGTGITGSVSKSHQHFSIVLNHTHEVGQLVVSVKDQPFINYIQGKQFCKPQSSVT